MKKRAPLALMLIAQLCFASLSPALAQTTPPAQQDDGDVVRITTNLVQVDVTVTDDDGRQVTDLRPEEFEVFEDGRRQQITNFSYVAVDPRVLEPRPRAESAKSADKNAPPVPPVPLKAEHVRRTFALVVDDFQMSFESMHQARRALRKFVDEQMGPGDLVAILRTSAGAGALQQFTTDKRHLHAAIERMRWSPRYSKGLTAFSNMMEASMAPPVAGSWEDPLGRDVSDAIDWRAEIYKEGSLGALEYITRGLKDLPGRKAVILLSDGLPIGGNVGANERIVSALGRLIELSNRASIVYYTIDARGLQPLNFSAGGGYFDSGAGFTAASAGGFPGRSGAPLAAADQGVMPHQMGRLLSGLRTSFFHSQAGMRYLADQTGGTFWGNNNDLSGAIGRAVEDQRGYYLIGYRPAESTFDPATGRRRFHELKVRVRRQGVRVRTRSGFLGITDSKILTDAKTGLTRKDQLIAAVNSPFAAGDIDLRLTSLLGSDPRTGSFVRSLLHIEARDLSFTEETDGWHRAVFDVMGVTFDASGKVVDEVNRTETIRVRGNTRERVLRDGLVYVLNVPVKKPGAYQLRMAVRDAVSARAGSANQFVEAPDLKKNRLALSGLVLAGSDPAAASSGGAASSLQMSVSREGAVNDLDVEAGPALRRLRQGLAVDFGYVIYNARLDKQTNRPRLQTQVRLFRDGKIVYAGKPTPYEASSQPDLYRLNAGGRLLFDPALPPGEYVLQVIVWDMLDNGKARMATQWMDFEIVK